MLYMNTDIIKAGNIQIFLAQVTRISSLVCPEAMITTTAILLHFIQIFKLRH